MPLLLSGGELLARIPKHVALRTSMAHFTSAPATTSNSTTQLDVTVGASFI
jgi:hypothetical protein